MKRNSARYWKLSIAISLLLMLALLITIFSYNPYLYDLITSLLPWGGFRH